MESFFNDIANHEAIILKNEGVYRHVHCRSKDKSEAWNQWFDIVTYPNVLVFSGDMGCFVFSRTNDMFSFFGGDISKVNGGYWSEKLIAVDRCDGYKEFSHDVFRDVVKDYYDNHCESNELSDDEKTELWGEITKNVLCAETEESAYRFASEFEHEGFEFYDFFEHKLTKASNRYIWAIHAIVWTIGKFNEKSPS